MGWNHLSIPKLQQLHRWSLGMDRKFHSTFYYGCNWLPMLGLKLIYVSKTGSGHNTQGEIPCYFESQMSEFVLHYSISVTTCWVVEVIQTQSFIINTLRLMENCCHFTDDVFKCIFLNGNVWISITISINFFPKGPINNITSLVHIMAWRWPSNKPLSEPMMTLFTDAYMHHSVSMS